MNVLPVLRNRQWGLTLCFCPAAFIRVVGSEFVQKYLGEGPRMVRDVFRLAKENAPAIIFIDEIDAIATKRFDAQTGGELGVRAVRPFKRWGIASW